jgi:hypothetical protein
VAGQNERTRAGGAPPLGTGEATPGVPPPGGRTRGRERPSLPVTPDLPSREHAQVSPVKPSNDDQIAQAQAAVAATTSPIVHNLLRQMERIRDSLDGLLHERAQIDADVVLIASDVTHARREEAVAQVEAAG